jgi:hypothetical protein
MQNTLKNHSKPKTLIPGQVKRRLHKTPIVADNN